MESRPEDLALCKELLPRVSRTFALSIEAMPEPLRTAVRTAYLLCRIVDTVEDDPTLDGGERDGRFELFRRLMADDGADPALLERRYAGRAHESDDLRLCRHAGASFRQFRALSPTLRAAIRPHVYEMSVGMARYARRWRGEDALIALWDLDDLHRYCFFVAGTVGNLLTDTFVAVEGDALSEPVRLGLRARAVCFGQGLQLTNIVKDVHADRQRGWCFLPREVLGRHGTSPERMLEAAQREHAMAAIREVADVAGRHLERALEYTLLVPARARDLRLFLIVPLALAFGTLTLVRRSPAVLEPGSVKLTRETVGHVLLEARRVLADDDGIRDLCARADALEL